MVISRALTALRLRLALLLTAFLGAWVAVNPARAQIETPELLAIYQYLETASPALLRQRFSQVEAATAVAIARAQRLPDVVADLQFNTTAERRPDFDDIEWRHRPFSRIYASQPIFHWFALKSNQAIAEFSVEIARLNYQDQVRGLKRETRRWYLAILDREASLAQARDREDSARRFLYLQESRRQLGRVSTADLLQAQSRLLQSQTQVLDEIRMLGETRQVFFRVSGFAGPVLADWPAVFETVLLSEPVAAPSPAPESPESAATRILALQVEQSRREATIARSATRPKLDLLLSLFQDEIDAQGGDSLTRDNLFVGIRLIWNLFDGFEADARTRLANQRQTALLQELAQSRLLLQREFALLTAQIEASSEAVSQRRLDLEARSSLVAQARLELERGRLTEDDLRNQQVELNQVRIDLLRTILFLDYKRSELTDLLTTTLEAVQEGRALNRHDMPKS